MSKLKEKAALFVGQVQAANTGSSAFTQIDNFSHFYDRGDHLVTLATSAQDSSDSLACSFCSEENWLNVPRPRVAKPTGGAVRKV